MTEVPRTAPEFVTWLVSRHPGIAPLLEEHLSDNHELLPHVLFGDVTRYAADLSRRAVDESEADTQLLRLLGDLDRAIHGHLDRAILLPAGEDDPVDNLVWVSFVENAQGLTGDPEEALRERMHSFPDLARALSHYE